MNAETRKPFSESLTLETEDLRASAVSALVDGELSEAELDELLGDEGAVPWDATWSTYHLIGDALRSGEAGLQARSSPDLADAVRRRLREEALGPAVSTDALVHVRGPAANASVFRWKMVAGLASLTAVAAVGWALTGSVTGPADATGKQLALVSQPSVPVVAQDVVVQTPQGPMSRDPRLEQLLAEHRQYGGMSAFQTPTGFLRNATYDTSPQR